MSTRDKGWLYRPEELGFEIVDDMPDPPPEVGAEASESVSCVAAKAGDKGEAGENADESDDGSVEVLGSSGSVTPVSLISSSSADLRQALQHIEASYAASEEAEPFTQVSQASTPSAAAEAAGSTGSEGEWSDGELLWELGLQPSDVPAPQLPALCSLLRQHRRSHIRRTRGMLGVLTPHKEIIGRLSKAMVAVGVVVIAAFVYALLDL